MRVKFILPALVEATSGYWRPIKYSLFPPLGLATLAGYLSDGDEIEIWDEHVQKLKLDDRPDLVVLQVYITSAYRAYQIADNYRAKGVHVILGGLHITSMSSEALQHGDSIFLGPGEDTWPQFLEDFRTGQPKKTYQSIKRTLAGLPKPRRDLFKRELYLVPNSIVVSRGCPYSCDFCYKDNFFRGGKSFYTQPMDDVLKEINSLPGRHLFFLDDHLFGDPVYAMELFESLRGVKRLWQAAGTIQAVLTPGLLEKAAESGLKSLFIGFETLSSINLERYNKKHNLYCDYNEAVRRLHDMGVMINASFVFGMDDDDNLVFDRTVDWAIEKGIETATFHILTPYPGTALYKRLSEEKRILHNNWDLYDTRHAVYRPAKMTQEELEAGYWKAYKNFYSWNSIFKSVFIKDSIQERFKHFAYTAGWKKFEPFWNFIIKAGKLNLALPILEYVLNDFNVLDSKSQRTADLKQINTVQSVQLFE